MTLIADRVGGHPPSTTTARAADDVAGVPVPAPSWEAEDPAVVAAARRIAATAGGVSETEVRAVLLECLEASKDAKVQNFRLLLAERQTRSRLSAR